MSEYPPSPEWIKQTIEAAVDYAVQQLQDERVCETCGDPIAGRHGLNCL